MKAPTILVLVFGYICSGFAGSPQGSQWCTPYDVQIIMGTSGAFLLILVWVHLGSGRAVVALGRDD